jgi:hypothetical protein
MPYTYVNIRLSHDFYLVIFKSNGTGFSTPVLDLRKQQFYFTVCIYFRKVMLKSPKKLFLIKNYALCSSDWQVSRIRQDL